MTTYRALRVAALIAGGLLTSTLASAQTSHELPDETETTTVTATVSPQARVTVPTDIAFTVTDIASSTDYTDSVSVAIDNIVLASAASQLKIEIKAAASAFTAPATGGTTYDAADVSWESTGWTSATGAAGTLGTTYSELASCDADAATCGNTSLTFKLVGTKAGIKRSGDHTLTVYWKFSEI